MENLPFPKLRTSRIAAMVLAVFLFLLYYLIIFQGLLYIYKDQFYKVSYPHDKSIVSDPVSNVEESLLESIEIEARIPKYIYAAGPLPIFISVTNNGSEIIKDIGVYFVSDDVFPLVLQNQYNKETFSTGTVFDEIAPHSIVVGRISLIAQTNTKINNVSIVVGSSHEERQSEGNVSRLIGWSWKTLQHSFIELILLPPWSNGLILALALFASYLSESKGCGADEDEEPEAFGSDWWECVWNNLRGSTLVIFVMVLFIMLFVYGVIFTFLLDLFLIWMIIKSTQKTNNFCKAFGFIVIIFASALIYDNPMLPLLFDRVRIADIPTEALWMNVFSAIAIVESLILIMLCAKDRIAPRVVLKNEKAPPPPPNSLQPTILNSPTRHLSPANKNKIDKKDRGKKKINKFETYDLGVDQRIRKEWRKIRERKDDDAEEFALRRLATQLEIKRYDETDWVWRVINYFRPRSARLQKLLNEIYDQIEKLNKSEIDRKDKSAAPTDYSKGLSESDSLDSNIISELASEEKPDGPKLDL